MPAVPKPAMTVRKLDEIRPDAQTAPLDKTFEKGGVCSSLHNGVKTDLVAGKCWFKGNAVNGLSALASELRHIDHAETAGYCGCFRIAVCCLEAVAMAS